MTPAAKNGNHENILAHRNGTNRRAPIAISALLYKIEPFMNRKGYLESGL